MSDPPDPEVELDLTPVERAAWDRRVREGERRGDVLPCTRAQAGSALRQARAGPIRAEVVRVTPIFGPPPRDSANRGNSMGNPMMSITFGELEPEEPEEPEDGSHLDTEGEMAKTFEERAAELADHWNALLMAREPVTAVTCAADLRRLLAEFDQRRQVKPIAGCKCLTCEALR